MSDPIDYIDLTIDQPDEPLKLRNRIIVKNNAKSRKRSSNKRQNMQLQDSIIEIPIENTCKDVEPEEIIDLDKINNTEKTGICYVNNSKEENLILTCPICYEQLFSKRKPMSTPCGHIYCTQCLKLALRKVKKCPTCQRTIKLQSCTRLYF